MKRTHQETMKKFRVVINILILITKQKIPIIYRAMEGGLRKSPWLGKVEMSLKLQKV